MATKHTLQNKNIALHKFMLAVTAAADYQKLLPCRLFPIISSIKNSILDRTVYIQAFEP
jgi:hypothetical protein